MLARWPFNSKGFIECLRAEACEIIKTIAEGLRQRRRDGPSCGQALVEAVEDEAPVASFRPLEMFAQQAIVMALGRLDRPGSFPASASRLCCFRPNGPAPRVRLWVFL